MRTYRVIAVTWIACLAAVASAAGQASDPPKTEPPAVTAPAPIALDELSKCEADIVVRDAEIARLNHRVAALLARLAQYEAPGLDRQIEQRIDELERKWRDRLKPPDGWIFDRSTLTFIPPPAPKK